MHTREKGTFIAFKASMLCKVASCLLIFTFTVTNVTYGYDRRDMDHLRPTYAPESEARTSAVESKFKQAPTRTSSARASKTKTPETHPMQGYAKHSINNYKVTWKDFWKLSFLNKINIFIACCGHLVMFFVGCISVVYLAYILINSYTPAPYYSWAVSYAILFFLGKTILSRLVEPLFIKSIVEKHLDKPKLTSKKLEELKWKYITDRFILLGMGYYSLLIIYLSSCIDMLNNFEPHKDKLHITGMFIAGLLLPCIYIHVYKILTGGFKTIIKYHMLLKLLPKRSETEDEGNAEQEMQAKDDTSGEARTSAAEGVEVPQDSNLTDLTWLEKLGILLKLSGILVLKRYPLRRVIPLAYHFLKCFHKDVPAGSLERRLLKWGLNINNPSACPDFLGFLRPYCEVKLHHPLIEHLFNALNGTGMFDQINHSNLSHAAKEKLKHIVAACSSVSMMASIILRLCGVRVYGVHAIRHTLLAFPLFSGCFLFLDFTLNRALRVNLRDYYRKEGSYYILKEEYQIPKKTLHKRIIALREKHGSNNMAIFSELSFEEMLNKHYLYIQIGGRHVLTASIYGNIGAVYIELSKQSSKSKTWNFLYLKNAAKVLVKAIAMDYVHAGAYCNLSNVCYYLALYYGAREMRLRQFNYLKRAIMLSQKTISLNPHIANGYIGLISSNCELACYYESLGRSKDQLDCLHKAIEAYEKSIAMGCVNKALFHSSRFIYKHLVRYYTALGDTKRAGECYEEAIKERPTPRRESGDNSKPNPGPVPEEEQNPKRTSAAQERDRELALLKPVLERQYPILGISDRILQMVKDYPIAEIVILRESLEIYARAVNPIFPGNTLNPTDDRDAFLYFCGEMNSLSFLLRLINIIEDEELLDIETLSAVQHILAFSEIIIRTSGDGKQLPRTIVYIKSMILRKPQSIDIRRLNELENFYSNLTGTFHRVLAKAGRIIEVSQWLDAPLYSKTEKCLEGLSDALYDIGIIFSPEISEDAMVEKAGPMALMKSDFLENKITAIPDIIRTAIKSTEDLISFIMYDAVQEREAMMPLDNFTRLRYIRSLEKKIRNIEKLFYEIPYASDINLTQCEKIFNKKGPLIRVVVILKKLKKSLEEDTDQAIQTGTFHTSAAEGVEVPQDSNLTNLTWLEMAGYNRVSGRTSAAEEGTPDAQRVKFADTSDTAFLRLQQEYQRALEYAYLGKTADLRKVLQYAQVINPDFKVPYSAQTLSTADYETEYIFFNALNMEIFIPANRFLRKYFNSSLPGGKQWNVWQLHINKKKKKEPYLGIDIRFTEFENKQYPGPVNAFSLGPYIFSNPDVSQMVIRHMFNYVTKKNQIPNAWLNDRAITAVSFEDSITAGSDLLLMHERAHVKDNIFTRLYIDRFCTDGFSLQNKARAILKPGSVLRHQIENDKEAIQEKDAIAKMDETSAFYVGIIDAMGFYLEDGNQDVAYAVFLLHLFNPSIIRYILSDLMQAVEDEFGIEFNTLGALVTNLQNRDEHPAQIALRILKKARAMDFWTDEERAEILARPGNASTSPAEGVEEAAISQIASSRRFATLLAMTEVVSPVSILTSIDSALIKGRVFNISVGRDIKGRYPRIVKKFRKTLVKLFPNARFNIASNGDRVVRVTCNKDTRERIGECEVTINDTKDLTPSDLLNLLIMTFIGSTIPDLKTNVRREEELDWCVDYEKYLQHINQLHLSLTGRPFFTPKELTSFTKGDHILINSTIKKIRNIPTIDLNPMRPVKRMSEDEVLEVLRAV